METVVDFKEYVASVEARAEYVRPLAFALGVRRCKNGKTLDVSYPVVNFSENFGTAAVLIDVLKVQDFKNGYHPVSLENLSEIYSCNLIIEN